MRLIADRPIYIKGVQVQPGQVFDTEAFGMPMNHAYQLLSRGVLKLPSPPRIIYHTKVVRPEAPEVKAEAEPFRNMPVPDAKPKTVAAKSDQVLPKPDVSEQGIADSGKRRKRGRPRTKRQ